MFKFKLYTMFTNFQAAIRRVLSVPILKPVTRENVTRESGLHALGEVILKET